MITQARSVTEVRSQFPSLNSGFAFLENAGGSQVPGVVIDEIARFYREDYAQSGASYRASQTCGAIRDNCKDFLNNLFGGAGLGDVAVGQSTTALFAMLANAYRQVLKPGDEIIISSANHESHIGCWERLKAGGVEIRFWGVDPASGLSSLSDLEALVSEKTKLICFSQTCNLLGDIVDVKAVAKIAKAHGAHTVVDVVASASHAAPDVADWDVDFCCLSCYKVYGPHMAALWGRSERWEELPAPNHMQIPRVGALNFELGCLSYESLAGFLALGRYFGFLAGIEVGPGAIADRPTIAQAYQAIRALEQPLNAAFYGWMETRRDIRILGPRSAEGRHPTFSFVADNSSSLDIEKEVNHGPFGIKSGHFYAWRACQAVGVQPDPGVVRVSALHYNTVDEIERVCLALDHALERARAAIQ